jgi:hypothetical protein
MPNAVSDNGAIGIRFIFTPTQLAFLRPKRHLAARTFEQRPDEPLSRNWQNPAEACNAGPAQEPIQHRFGLIGLRMPCGDSVNDAIRPEPCEECLPRYPCFLLDVAGRKIDGFGSEGESVPVRQLTHQVLVGIGLGAAQTVIQMKHTDSRNDLAQ